nr:rhodanese-like domain-containing protein [Dyella sp. ASV24]
MQQATKRTLPAALTPGGRSRMKGRIHFCLLMGAVGTLPLWSLHAATNNTAAAQCPALVEAAKHKAPPQAAPTVRPSSGSSCLVSAAALDAPGVEIIDIRDRTQFLQFHVPGAQQASAATLTTLPGLRNRKTVVYGDGKFRSDTIQLCERLRQSGLQQVTVVDGGIAAWAQLHGREEVLATNRLSDAEIAAALAEPGNTPVILADSLKSLASVARSSGSPKARRNVVLADAATPVSAIQAQLSKGAATSLYWVGSSDQLSRLLDTQLAQDRKRLAGHGESATCSSL